MSKQRNWIYVLFTIIAFCVLFVMLYAEYLQQAENEEKAREYELQRREELLATDQNSICLSASYPNQIEINSTIFNRLVDYEEFLQDVERESNKSTQGASVYYRLDISSEETANYLITFKMRADVEATRFQLKIGNIRRTLYLTTPWQQYCIPYQTKDNISFSLNILDDFQITELSDFEIYIYNSDEVEAKDVPCGYYLLEETELNIGHTSVYKVGNTSDIILDGPYMYSVGQYQLIISSLENPLEPTVISTLGGLGNVRRIEQINDKTIAVASRQNGVFLIDVSDKNNPRIITRYNSLDTANDICVSGDVMIIMDRYFGFEFVDISNLSEPQYINHVYNEKECYRGTISGNYLFVSCWATREVEIYDISNIDSPILVGSLPVEGYCGEAFVENNMIYIASGYKTGYEKVSLGDFGYGTGNGLTIYDISDPENPVWKSTVKCDGSMFTYAWDDWSVQVSDGYAYFTTSYDGIYIYDVTDSSAPKRVGHITYSYRGGEQEEYIDIASRNGCVFPYDSNEYICAANWSVALADGYICFGIENEGIGIQAIDYCKKVSSSNADISYTWNKVRNTTSNTEMDVALQNYDVFAVDMYNNGGVIVGTDKGIIILNSEMNIISQYNTEETVKDLIYKDGYIYSSEYNRISIYQIVDNEIVLCSTYDNFWDEVSIVDIEITADNRYLIVQAYWSRVVALDIQNKNAPKFVSTIMWDMGGEQTGYSLLPGAMYGKNLTNQRNGVIGIYGNQKILWVTSQSQTLNVVDSYTNKLYSELGGITLLDSGKALVSYGGGLVCFDPLTSDEESLENEYRALVSPDIFIGGKLISCGNAVCMSRVQTGEMWLIDYSTEDAPRIIDSFNFDGNPQSVYLSESDIWIAGRHAGLLKIAY